MASQQCHTQGGRLATEEKNKVMRKGVRFTIKYEITCVRDTEGESFSSQVKKYIVKNKRMFTIKDEIYHGLKDMCSSKLSVFFSYTHIFCNFQQVS